MKLFIVLTVAAFVAVASAGMSEEKLAKIKVLKEQCVAETGADPAVCDKFMAGDFSNADMTSKCFVRCFYQKAGFFDADNNLDLQGTVDKIASEFGAEKAEKWTTPCKDIQHADPCEKAFAIAQCFHTAKTSRK